MQMISIAEQQSDQRRIGVGSAQADANRLTSSRAHVFREEVGCLESAGLLSRLRLDDGLEPVFGRAMFQRF